MVSRIRLVIMTPPATPKTADSAAPAARPRNSPSRQPQRVVLVKRKQEGEEEDTPAKKPKVQHQLATKASHPCQQPSPIADKTTNKSPRVVLRTKKTVHSSQNALGIVVDHSSPDQRMTSTPASMCIDRLEPAQSSSSSSSDFSEGDQRRTDLIRELEFQTERAIEAANHEQRDKLGPERAPQWIRNWVEERRIEMEEEELARAVQHVNTHALKVILKEEVGVVDFEL